MSLILPNTPLAKAAELSVTDANLLALAQLVAANMATNAAAIKVLADRLGVDEGTLATLAGLIPPPIIVPPLPAYDPQIQWRTGMESGDLSAWSEKVNTGFADSTAVQVALEGIPERVSRLFNLRSVWVMKQAVTAPSGTAEASGTRMSRYPEINALCKAGTTFYYSWWDFFPQALAYNASGWYNHWQIMGNDPAMKNAPIWVLGLSGSGMNPVLVWSPNNLAPAEGPHAGEAGSKVYSSTLAVPVGQWAFFEVMVKPAADFTGALKMWLNGQVLFDLSAIKTQFPLMTQSLYAYIANNCYGVGFQTPWGHYVDDVVVSLGRLP